MKLKKSLIILILFTGINSVLNGQILKTHWQINNARTNLMEDETLLQKMPQHYLIYDISIPTFSVEMKMRTHEISIPNPNGEFEVFEIEPSNVVAAEVAHLYTIKTFKGFKKGNPTVKIACDISEGGFHAAIYDASNTYFISSLISAAKSKVAVYFNKDRNDEKTKCQVTEHRPHDTPMLPSGSRTPDAKSTFRLAITAAGEYSQQFGGSPYNVTNVLNSIAAGVNMVNPIYLRDLGIEFTLVTTPALVFEDAETDPYTDIFDGNELVLQSHSTCTNTLGSANFDVGHLVIWDDLGGLASLEAICDDEYKGEGYSGSTGATTTTLWVDYVCHEIGHQFGSDHNFSSAECDTSVDNFRYEPGEGSSIMSYAGVCGGAARYTNASDPYFHYASINQIQNYVGGVSCMVSGGSNSSAPVSDTKSNITIPKQTPFILVGDASDGNDPVGNLTYHWEQYDGSGSAVTGSPDCNSTTASLFRHRPPVSDKFRNLPQYDDVLAGNNNAIMWEKLPCAARSMNFSLAIRDNNSSFGRVHHDQMTVTVANTGPFDVTAPNGGETLTGNAPYIVTWTVNGTNAHCANVDILISTDGGASYNIVADATANDGTESITVPNTATTTARVLVRCDVTGAFRAASTFYDVSNANSTITTALPVELARFYGKNMGTYNQLNWETFSERNNKGFEVQRQIKGNEWKTLSFVEGADNANSQQFYEFADRSPLAEANYYRLAQFDFNGETTFSDVVAIQNQPTKPKSSFYPNPSSNDITFFNVLTNTKIQVLDAQGQLVLQAHLNPSNTLDISYLSSGIYFIIVHENGIKNYDKLIKK